jgi:hypothetical protein
VAQRESSRTGGAEAAGISPDDPAPVPGTGGPIATSSSGTGKWEQSAEPLAPSSSHPDRTGRADEDTDSFTAEELATASGAALALVHDLQRYGLIAPRAAVGGIAYFDTWSLAVARAAAGLARHGIEARHLRGWRNAADREVGLFEQVIMPLLRQRNPQARRQAADTLAELASLGASLRAALVEHGLSELR